MRLSISNPAALDARQCRDERALTKSAILVAFSCLNRGPLALTENQALPRPYSYWMSLVEGIHYVNGKVIQGYGRNLAQPQSTYHGCYTYCDLVADSTRHFQTDRESRFSQRCAEVEIKTPELTGSHPIRFSLA